MQTSVLFVSMVQHTGQVPALRACLNLGRISGCTSSASTEAQVGNAMQLQAANSAVHEGVGVPCSISAVLLSAAAVQVMCEHLCFVF